MSNYLGVDWAADKHDVRVADETDEKLLASTFARQRDPGVPEGRVGDAELAQACAAP
jgi:hypothetical protein